MSPQLALSVSSAESSGGVYLEGKCQVSQMITPSADGDDDLGFCSEEEDILPYDWQDVSGPGESQRMTLKQGTSESLTVDVGWLRSWALSYFSERIPDLVSPSTFYSWTVDQLLRLYYRLKENSSAELRVGNVLGATGRQNAGQTDTLRFIQN